MSPILTRMLSLALLISVVCAMPTFAQETSTTPYQLSPDECRLAITDLVQTQQGVFDQERKAFDEAEKKRFDAETQAFESAKYVAARFNRLLDDLQDERIKIIAKTQEIAYGEWGKLIDSKLDPKAGENKLTCKPDAQGNRPIGEPMQKFQDKMWLQETLHDGPVFRNSDGSYPEVCGRNCRNERENFYVDIRTGISEASCSTGIDENKYLLHVNQSLIRFRAFTYDYLISTLTGPTLLYYLNCSLGRISKEACQNTHADKYHFSSYYDIYNTHSDIVRACDGAVCLEKEILQLQTMSKVTPEEVYLLYEGKSEITPMRQAPDQKIEKDICAKLEAKKSPCARFYEGADGHSVCNISPFKQSEDGLKVQAKPSTPKTQNLPSNIAAEAR